MKKKFLPLVLIPAVLLCSGCVRTKTILSEIRPCMQDLWEILVSNGSTLPGDPVIARVCTTGSVIRASDLRKQFSVVSDSQRDRYLSPNGSDALLQDVIDLRIFALAGRQMGIESDPQFRQDMQEYRYRLMAGHYQRLLLHSGLRVTDAEIQNYYAHDKAYQPELTLWVRQIRLGSLSDAKIALRLLKKKSFEDVARRMSTDKVSGANGGLLPPMTEKWLAPAQKKILQDLHKGKVSGIRKNGPNFFILRIDDERLVAPPLETVREDIRRLLENQKLVDWAKGARQQCPIEIDKKILGSIDFKTNGTKTPATNSAKQIP